MANTFVYHKRRIQCGLDVLFIFPPPIRQLGDIFIRLCIETRILDCLWRCLEQVFDLNLINNPTRSLHPPDWCMLSPRGVHFVLQLGKLIYTKVSNIPILFLFWENKAFTYSLHSHSILMVPVYFAGLIV